MEGGIASHYSPSVSISSLRECPQCNQAVGHWRLQCVCGYRFGDPITSDSQKLDDLIRSIEGAPSVGRPRSLDTTNVGEHRESNPTTEKAVTQKPGPVQPTRNTAWGLRVSAVATVIAVGIAVFQYMPSKEDTALVRQAQSFTDAAQTNYELALTNREACETVVRAWREHQRIEAQANSTIMGQDVYSRGKDVKNAWNAAANRIDDVKERLQALVTRCGR